MQTERGKSFANSQQMFRKPSVICTANVSWAITTTINLLLCVFFLHSRKGNITIIITYSFKPVMVSVTNEENDVLGFTFSINQA